MVELERIYTLKDFPLAIEPKNVYKWMGYRGGIPSRKERDIIGDACRECLNIIRPRGVYMFTAESVNEDVFGDCSSVALGICTIGEAVESRAKELTDAGKLLKGLAVDTAGSALAEGAAEYLDGIIRSRAREEGLNAGGRVSPGFGLWKLEEQKELFRRFQDRTAGVNLTDSCLMVPRKSVSFGMGLGGSGEGAADLCEECILEECDFKKEREKK